jgi:hypothetical protein
LEQPVADGVEGDGEDGANKCAAAPEQKFGKLPEVCTHQADLVDKVSAWRGGRGAWAWIAGGLCSPDDGVPWVILVVLH